MNISDSEFSYDAEKMRDMEHPLHGESRVSSKTWQEFLSVVPTEELVKCLEKRGRVVKAD